MHQISQVVLATLSYTKSLFTLAELASHPVKQSSGTMQSAISSGTRLRRKIVTCFIFMQSKPGSFCEIAAYISVSAESMTTDPL